MLSIEAEVFGLGFGFGFGCVGLLYYSFDKGFQFNRFYSIDFLGQKFLPWVRDIDDTMPTMTNPYLLPKLIDVSPVIDRASYHQHDTKSKTSAPIPLPQNQNKID